jgi:hypothetical protein
LEKPVAVLIALSIADSFALMAFRSFGKHRGGDTDVVDASQAVGRSRGLGLLEQRVELEESGVAVSLAITVRSRFSCRTGSSTTRRWP